MTPDEIIQFWLGDLDHEGLATDAAVARWWRKDTNFDADVHARFGSLWSALMRGEHDDWREQARSLLAYVLVLDQFPRNMFRAKAQAFASDAKALAAAKLGIEHGLDRTLRGHERLFLYLPFMHSEQLADQEQCVTLLSNWRDEASGRLRDALASNVDFAVRHRDIIAQWGRFPHRNQVLDRTCTDEELAFLEGPNSSF